MTMPDDPKDGGRVPVEGLAGGPGPTPPGFDDGTPHAEAPRSPGEDPQPLPPAPAEDAEGEGGRRAAGGGGAARRDPEEPDPS